jgi:hypothetical protein
MTWGGFLGCSGRGCALLSDKKQATAVSLHQLGLRKPTTPAAVRTAHTTTAAAAAAAAAVLHTQVKMKELGVLGNDNYKLVCMLDHKAMLTVQTEKYGVFDCKPLQFIWAKVRPVGTEAAVPDVMIVSGAPRARICWTVQ